MKFTQIRSATSIVEFGDKRFLIDPMLAKMGAYPDVPFTSTTGRGNPDCELPCPPEAVFRDADAVIVTHYHFDHFDEAAAKLLPKALPLFARCEEEAALYRGFGFEDVRLLEEEGAEFEGVKLYRTRCDHGRSSLTTRLAYAEMGFTDEACGVVFESPKEPRRFYLAGDTVFCDYVVEAVKKFRPAVVAVNAAGAQFPLGHPLIMNQYDVLALMKMFPELDVIATHVEGVSHATVTRPMLRAFATENRLEKLRIPADGETLEF